MLRSDRRCQERAGQSASCNACIYIPTLWQPRLAYYLTLISLSKLIPLRCNPSPVICHLLFILFPSLHHAASFPSPVLLDLSLPGSCDVCRHFQQPHAPHTTCTIHLERFWASVGASFLWYARWNASRCFLKSGLQTSWYGKLFCSVFFKKWKEMDRIILKNPESPPPPRDNRFSRKFSHDKIM